MTNAWDDANWNHIVNVHRKAIEAGGEDALPLAIITEMRCEENNRPRPEWLTAVLAEWAAAHLTGDAKKLERWPEPKMGSRSNRSTNIQKLREDMRIRAIYESMETGRRIGRINNEAIGALDARGNKYSYDFDLIPILALVLGVPKPTLRDTLDRTEKYAKEFRMFGPNGEPRNF